MTVLVCCYNGATTLSAALDSVITGTDSGLQYEILLIDDGSVDDTGRIGQAYASRFENLKYIRQESNLGLVPACNVGLKEAKGSCFVRLDADDTFQPGVVASMLKIMEDGWSDLVCGDR